MLYECLTINNIQEYISYMHYVYVCIFVCGLKTNTVPYVVPPFTAMKKTANAQTTLECLIKDSTDSEW